MAVYRVKGPAGAVALITVPSAAFDQRTFDARIARGELTILEVVEADEAVAADDDVDAAPAKRGGTGKGSGGKRRDAAASTGDDAEPDLALNLEE